MNKSRSQILIENGYKVSAAGTGWSFVNEKEKKVCFSGWEDLVEKNGEIYILSASWRFRKDGGINPSYSKAVEHVKRVARNGYSLHVIPLTAVDINVPTRKIKFASDNIIPCELVVRGAEFFAKIIK